MGSNFQQFYLIFYVGELIWCTTYPLRLVIYDGSEQVERVDLPGDVSEYDIIIQSTVETEYPSKRNRDSPPEIPEIQLEEIEKENNKQTYRRMRDSPNSQPALIRDAIFQFGLLTRRQLDLWAKEHDYAPRGGGIRSSLIVLENITNEIKRIGDDDDNQRIVWTGRD